MGSKVNLGSFGVTGSKGHFHQKCYDFFILHSMSTKLIHVHKLETFYLFCGVKCQPGVIWGKKFLPETLYLPISDILTIIGLVHTHQLGTLCLCYGVNGQPGVVGSQNYVCLKCWLYTTNSVSYTVQC